MKFRKDQPYNKSGLPVVDPRQTHQRPIWQCCFGFGCAKNGTRVPFFVWSLTLVPCSLLRNHTKMLAMQAKDSVSTILSLIVASLTNKKRKTNSTWSPVIRHRTCSWWWGLLKNNNNKKIIYKVTEKTFNDSTLSTL